jgi:hypothetical protein
MATTTTTTTIITIIAIIIVVAIGFMAFYVDFNLWVAVSTFFVSILRFLQKLIILVNIFGLKFYFFFKKKNILDLLRSSIFTKKFIRNCFLN